MHLERGMLLAFSAELVKLATMAGKPLVTPDLEEVKEILKPGDIINTKVREGHTKGIDKFFVWVSRKIQGSPYTHSSMYVGDGKIVNMGTDNKGEFTGPETPTKLQPIDVLKKHYEFKVLRPIRATWSERQKAADWMKTQAGKVMPSAWKIVRMGLPIPKKSEERVREEPGSSACSEMVANAYPNQPFGAGRASMSVRPVDIEKSPLTRTIAVFKPDDPPPPTKLQRFRARLGSH